MALTKQRIFLVDRHALAREGLRSLIDAQADLMCCGERAACQESLPVLAAARPDLVVIEPLCADGFCTDFITKVRARRPAPRILVVSMGEEVTYAERVIWAGANGYCSKDRSGAEILAAIRQVLRGETAVSKSINELLLQRLTTAPAKTVSADAVVDVFSNRELEVFRLIGQGQTTDQISQKLRLSSSAVDTYRLRVREKLGLKTGTELTYRAICWVESANRQNYQI